MKINKWFIISVFLLKYCFSWTPDSLYENYTTEMLYETSTLNKTILSKVIDPNGYIRNLDEIYEKIVIIEQNYNISFLLIVIDEIDDPYLPWFGAKKNVDRVRIFAKEFQELYYKNNETLLDNSMTLLIAIQDRKMRIDTGKTVQNEFSAYGKQRLLDNIKPELRKKRYTRAFTIILNNIIDYDVFMYRHYFLIIAIIAVLLIFFCVGMWVGIKQDKEKNFANLKISKINNLIIELHKGDKQVRNIISENCAICLEKFKKVGENTEDGLEIPLLELDEKQINTLDCGHMFHSGCINKWKEVEIECPLCLEKMRDSDSPQEFSAKLYNIQRNLYPNLKAEKINMNGGILSLVE